MGSRSHVHSREQRVSECVCAHGGTLGRVCTACTSSSAARFSRSHLILLRARCVKGGGVAKTGSNT